MEQINDIVIAKNSIKALQLQIKIVSVILWSILIIFVPVFSFLVDLNDEKCYTEQGGLIEFSDFGIAIMIIMLVLLVVLAIWSVFHCTSYKDSPVIVYRSLAEIS